MNVNISRSQVILSALLLVASFLCLGMGSMSGSGAVNKIPEPDRAFTVKVVDQSDTSFPVEKLSVEGVTYIPAKLGKADLGIDFAQVSRAVFHREGEKVSADVFFRNGDTRRIGIEPGVSFYGVSPWGKMRLLAKDIKEIEFRQP